MMNKTNDIALIQPPGWAIQNPPLGLALLKSHLAGKGIQAKAYDLNIILYNMRHKEFKDSWDNSKGYYLWEKESFVNKLFTYYSDEALHFVYSVLATRPSMIGFSAHCSSFLSARLLAAKFRQYAPEIPIVFGGPQVANYTSTWMKLLQAQTADAIVFGEGEESLCELIVSYQSRLNAPIKGVAFRDPQGQIICGEARELIRPLDSVPFADFSDFDLKLYAGLNVLPTYFSRGCINTCIYCTENKYFPKFRNRSGKRLYDEIIYQLTLYPRTEYFRLHDSVSNGNVRELESFCDLLIENKIKIKFNLENAIIRKEMNTRLYDKLRKAGCTLIGYGLETPSKRLLRSIGKNACLNADFDLVVTEGVKARMIVGINMMFGLPGETADDFQMQIDFIRRHKRERKNILINPALNYTYFPEGCAVHTDPLKFSIDLSKSELFWTSLDGSNNFLDRMGKFEKFCTLAYELGYSNLFNITESVNKYEMLGNYYMAQNQYDRALENLIRSFDTEAKTLEVAENILALYDKLSRPHDEVYENIVQYRTAYKRDFISWLDLVTTRQELDDFIIHFSLAASINRLNSIIETLSEPPATLTLSVKGIKKYVLYAFSKLFSMSDKRYIMLSQSLKDLDNKVTALAASRNR